ncbi:tetratricopeptide repeat protein [Eleftheria terrae]|uniref:tetratricopeptide repeat protein n=1 Tax=Eleftheria terrae TaxID=1597781 RepID=UPI00263B0266|nr:sel1 repeat family protein [Eleftheria terrae]WKB55467.1 sel1 repeat family protein [Eleftheria terrae]
MMRRLLTLCSAALLLGCGSDPQAELAAGKRLLLQAGADAGAVQAGLLHLQAAADEGLPAAAYHLGLLYRRGAPGVPADAAAAERWLVMAAQAGLPQAQFALAQALRAPAGGPAREAEARHWLERAAEQELPEAHLALALAHRHGELGLEPDDRTAQLHFMEAQHALRHPRPAP